MAELLLGQPIFPGENGVDQLVEIIKVLGTPTKEEIAHMNPNYTEVRQDSLLIMLIGCPLSLVVSVSRRPNHVSVGVGRRFATLRIDTILLSSLERRSSRCNRLVSRLALASLQFKFPQIPRCPWDRVFRNRAVSPEAVDLSSKLLEYIPTDRVTLWNAMIHPFFHEIRDPGTTFEGKPLPALFNFTPTEMADVGFVQELIPPHAR